MSKKSQKKIIRPLSPRPAPEREDTAFLVREELESQPESDADSAEVQTHIPAEEQPAPPVTNSQPLAPLAALWPSTSPTGEETNSNAEPKVQKKPGKSSPAGPGTSTA